MTKSHFKKYVTAWLLIMMPCSLIAANCVQQSTSNTDKQASIIHKQLQKDISSNKEEITILRKNLETSKQKIDSLEGQILVLQKELQTSQTNTSSKIEATNSSISALNHSIKSKAIICCSVLAFIILILSLIIFKLRKNIHSTVASVEETKDAQKGLQESQQQLENGTISLNSKVADLLNAHLSSTIQANQQDHSLALKVADEIVRIETNLYRMDPATRGYKQLTRSVQRMKDCFMTKGYEISDLLGKPYNEGMKVVANLVEDESLPEGSAIITGIIKPQIIYNGKMIQAAQITVSQNK